MEINGIANLHLLVGQLNEDVVVGDVSRTIESMKKQLDLLQRYMLSYKDARDEYTTYNTSEYLERAIPKWHEVIASPEKYPLLKERMNGTKG